MPPSIRYRPTRFQLTALLDLLLIVVFAQFMEIREMQDRQAVAFGSKLAEQQRRAADAEASAAAAQRIQGDQAAQIDRALTTVRQRLSAQQPVDLPADQRTELAALQETLAQASPGEIVRFLAAYNELLKRAEVWELHADARGQIELRQGQATATFRLEARRQAERAEEFAARFYQQFKSLPQPKGLVIILASYDLQSTAGVYQAIIDGMPLAMQKLRNEEPNKRFEYTVLGALSR